MSGSTSEGLPYPSPTDTPDVPAWLQSLAEAAQGLFLNPERCYAYQGTAATSIANNTLTILDLDTELYDSNGLHSTSSNKSRITFVKGGTYRVDGQVGFAAVASPAGIRSARIALNGATTVGFAMLAVALGSTPTPTVPVTADVVVSPGDYVELQAQHTQGASLSTALGRQGTWLRALRIAS